MGLFSQFLLLTWKNWLIQKRRVLLTIAEIILPCVLAALLIAIRTRIVIERFDNGQEWDSFKVDRLPDSLKPLWDFTTPPNVTIPQDVTTPIGQPPNETTAVPPNVSRPVPPDVRRQIPWKIAYCPKNNVTQNIMRKVFMKLNLPAFFSLNCKFKIFSIKTSTDLV